MNMSFSPFSIFESVNLFSYGAYCNVCLRLSGLIVDVFGDVAVIASSAAWVEKYRPEIEACIHEYNGINHLHWRPSLDMLKEEGLESSSSKEDHSLTSLKRVKVRVYIIMILMILLQLRFPNIYQF